MTHHLVNAKLENYLVETYKHLHQHPELSGNEHQTQAFIIQELEKLGIPYKIMAGTGICAQIQGDLPGKCILIREDMDALPIEEQTNLEYASRNHGAMHACGHDAHITLGLGVATLLQGKRSELKGTVKIMFQPSEESHPGGAKPMIEEGILNNPKVDAAIGFHTNPFLLPGKFELKEGYMLANSDRVYITVLGKGGHAAAPHQSIDPVAMVGQFLAGVQNIPGRQIAPVDPGVITFGSIHGGTKSNVIADRVELAGTVRTINPETQEIIKNKLEALLQSVASYWGGSYEFKYVKGYPAAWNDNQMTDLVRQTAKSIIGEDSIVELDHPYLSGDDFAYLSREVPSVFVYWGTGSNEKENFPWHHAKFHVNVDAFKYGVTLATQTILNFLEGN